MRLLTHIGSFAEQYLASLNANRESIAGRTSSPSPSLAESRPTLNNPREMPRIGEANTRHFSWILWDFSPAFVFRLKSSTRTQVPIGGEDFVEIFGNFHLVIGEVRNPRPIPSRCLAQDLNQIAKWNANLG